MGCHFLLQEIFPTQGLNPDLSHCRQMLYHQSHQGSPGKMEEGWKSDGSQLGVAALLSPGGCPHDTPSLAGGLCRQAGGSKNDWQGPWMPLQSSYSQEGSG